MGTALRTATVPARTPTPSKATPGEGRPEEPPPLLVVPPRYRRRRAGLVAIGALLTGFAVMVGLVTLQTRLAARQARLDQLEGQVRAEQVRYDRLRGDVALLESPQRIVDAARAQGMVDPAEVKYVSTPPEAVAAVAAASGLGPLTNGAVGPTDAATGEWSTVKPVVGGAP